MIEEAYKIAKAELGEQEIKGQAANPKIVEYHSTTTLKATSDEVPWCSAFVCWCLEKAGIRSTRLANARSFMVWGKAVETPYEGCVVVIRRGLGQQTGHVGFFVRADKYTVHILGGNQGDQVCVKGYPISEVLAYREPGLVE